MYVGIICASLPSLKTFGAHRFPNLFKTSSDAVQPRNDRLRFSLLSPIALHLRTWTTRRRANRMPVDEEDGDTVVDKSNVSALSETRASHSGGLTRAGTETGSPRVVKAQAEGGRAFPGRNNTAAAHSI